MRLSLYRYEHGIEAEPGNRVVYDLAAGEASFGEASAPGRALVWELHEDEPVGAQLSAEVELGSESEWLMRCDRVDFPPGGVAYLHTHPGPGIRCLLFGSLRVETEGHASDYGPLEPWFERGPDPVLATASPTAETAFVRVMLLPREWEGRRTIQYVNAEDAELPKRQRATVFFERAITQ